MKIPLKITPCPIVEAIVEIRFQAKVPSEAIFGMVYKSLREEYPKENKLPILQLPEPIRIADPNLRSKPHYQLLNEGFILQIGPEVVSLNTKKEYVGWNIFSEKIHRAFSEIANLDLIEKVTRFGIRYINFFDFNIYDKINLAILMNNESIRSKSTYIRTEIQDDKFVNILQITNNAKINIDNKEHKGSVIDIDTVMEEKYNDFFDRMKDFLEEGHRKEKKLFFSLPNEATPQTDKLVEQIRHCLRRNDSGC
jgi:uncharacterized protein (TIGR04255 family)